MEAGAGRTIVINIRIGSLAAIKAAEYDDS